MTRYDDIDYWDDRYSNDTEPFEWYQTYSGIRHFLTPKYLCRTDNAQTSRRSTGNAETLSSADNFPHANRVLILGCGNSELGQHMLQDGFTFIANVDFSSVVINQMKKKYTDDWYREMHQRLREERKLNDVGGNNTKPSLQRTKLSNISPAEKESKKKPVHNKMTFQCLDVTKKLEFDAESFDLIVCKGTLDAILCNQNAFDKVQSMMSECHRVLDNKHGVMVVVSYGRPDDRLTCFDTDQWREVKTYTVPKPLVPGMTDVGA